MAKIRVNGEMLIEEVEMKEGVNAFCMILCESSLSPFPL